MSALFANYARINSKKNAAIQVESLLLNAYKEYINANHNCFSEKHRKDTQAYFLITMNTCCKYIIDGFVEQKLCKDNLKEFIEIFENTIRTETENDNYHSIKDYIKIHYPEFDINKKSTKPHRKPQK
ncbi:hypothetical protein NHP21005_03020 [Helicobacter sp. NHP21005]|uniref:hypothetical protein n=1 Tax=Helicobacter felistomachi TaxID=3040201 RepID=UPI0025748049|nr:hypothetical protein [Helicobacter sp. NHP21005]BEG56614.1 hypothetical protein NHP21005_03020 [Helicobacter sp. NHP21005]